MFHYYSSRLLLYFWALVIGRNGVVKNKYVALIVDWYGTSFRVPCFAESAWFCDEMNGPKPKSISLSMQKTDKTQTNQKLEKVKYTLLNNQQHFNFSLFDILLHA